VDRPRQRSRIHRARLAFGAALLASTLAPLAPAAACPPGYPVPGEDPDADAAEAGDGGTGASFFHPDEQHVADNQDPYVGPGWAAAEGGAPAVSFDASGVSLLSWIPLGDFDASATDGSDCWGYTSPSGREYAFIGLDTGTGVAEVTDPANAQVIAHLDGPSSIWRDIKTYDHYAYIVSEGGGGIQVYDLAQIDDGIITPAAIVTTGGGTFATHNVAINETSGRLYRARGGSFEILEGDWTPVRLVIIEFPDMEHLKQFYECEEYLPYREIRQRLTESKLVALDGVAEPMNP